METDTALEAALSITLVVVFIGVLVFLSTLFSTDGGMDPMGGYALVASLVAFTFIISGAGLYLTHYVEGEGED